VSVANWTSPATIAEAHAWLRHAAAAAGRRVTGPIEQPHVRPWSTVFRAPTDQGDVYLKLCGPSQDFEPALTALLARTAPDVVPTVLAIHPREPWMLLADGGAKLRDVLRGPALLEAWAGVLPHYAELQRRLLGHDAELLACGIPDRRLDHLPADLDRILDDDRIVARASAERLRALRPAIDADARDLASTGIGATAQHDDLHDANALRLGDRTVVFDWGDASLTHPFLSLWVLLRAAAHWADTATNDPAIVRLRDAYLEPWTSPLPRRAVEEAADRAMRLATLTRALTWYRVVTLDEGALEGEPAMMGEYLDMVINAFG